MLSFTISADFCTPREEEKYIYKQQNHSFGKPKVQHNWCLSRRRLGDEKKNYQVETKRVKS